MIIPLLFLLAVITVLSIIRYRYLKEGFNNPWLEDYNAWRKEYMTRYNNLCPLYKEVNGILKQIGEQSLEVRGGGKLVICGLEGQIPPASPSLDKALLFFDKFPSESEDVLLRTIKIINDLLKTQSDAINKSFSPETIASAASGASASTYAMVAKLSEANEGFSAQDNGGFFGDLFTGPMSQEKEEADDAQTYQGNLSEDQKEQMIQNIVNTHLESLEKTKEFVDLYTDSKKTMDYINKIKGEIVSSAS